MTTLNYITDRPIDGQAANAIARKSMAQSFSLLKDVLNVNFVFVSNSNDFEKTEEQEKLNVKPIVMRTYKEQSFSKKDRLIRAVILNPVIMLKLLRACNQLCPKKDSFNFVRGEKAGLVVWLLSLVKGFPYAYEIHNYEFGRSKLKDYFNKKIFKKASFVVTISKYTKENWIKNGILEDNILVLPSGVDIEAFDLSHIDKTSLRKKLGLPREKKIIMYCGQLLYWKGIDTLIESFQYNQSKDVLLLVVGGNEMDIQKYKRKSNELKLNNIRFVGHQPFSKIPKYMRSADILVLPNSGNYTISNLHTSPIKLFEYLASKTPVIASNLPSIKQFVSNEEVTFFEPDNPEDLWANIVSTLVGDETTKNNLKKGFKKASSCTWQSRAEQIYNKI